MAPPLSESSADVVYGVALRMMRMATVALGLSGQGMSPVRARAAAARSSRICCGISSMISSSVGSVIRLALIDFTIDDFEQFVNC